MKSLLTLFLIGFSYFMQAQTVKTFPILKGEYLGQKPPKTIPEVFAPGIVSDTTWAEHCQVAISPNGDEIFWSVYTSEYPKIDGTGNTEQLYYSRLENGSWTKPKIAEFTGDNKYGGNGGPVFSLDGKKLFFSQRKPRDKYMYYVEKENGQWSTEPISIGEPYNTKIGNVATNWTPVFTKKGNAYKYSKGIISKYNYVNEKFTFVDTIIIHKDFRPRWNIYVSPYEDYVIFATKHKSGFGDIDIYISFKDKNEKWGYPINMGDKINTKTRERFPVVSPDGKYLFFMRHTQTQDFFWVSTDIIYELKTQSLDN